MSHKIFIDYDDEYRHYYDDVDELIADELKQTIYIDSPEHIIKKLHYEEEIKEYKDLYYICPYKGCNAQPVYKTRRDYHDNIYHPNLWQRFIKYIFCRYL